MNSFTFNSKNTFCISLLSNKDRFDKMKKRFEMLNMDVTIWPASTPNELTNEFVHYLNDRSKACTQSHYNVWKHIISQQLEYALILEDDACFDKEFLNKTNQFFSDVKDAEWDALFLNASETIDIRNKWCLQKEQYLCGGYILSKRGCEKLINMYSSCLYMSDWMTTRLQLYNHSYSYFPWIIIQEGKETTIGSNIDADHEKVIRLLKDANYSLDNYLT